MNSALAACGGTVRTWTAGGGSSSWNTTTNWSGSNVPNSTTEDAVIISATRPTSSDTTLSVGCVEVQSGELRSSAGITLSVTKDYFRALSLNTLNITSTSYFINMAGTAAQTFEAVDPITNLTISNNSTVTLTQPFSISSNLQITGTTTNLNIDADLILVSGISTFTIPAGTTVNLRSGATLTANTNITVNGTLILENGATLIMGNGRTLAVSSTGSIQLNGASGNVAKIDGSGSGTSYTFTMAGLMSANYFRISRTTTNGVSINGSLQSLNNGEFHYIATSGRAITLQAGSSVPATMTDLSFYDDSAFGNAKNINATAYTGAVTTIQNWAGSVGGATFETDTANKITWGTQASTKLVLTNTTASGSPPTTIAQSSADTIFATFGFSLNQTSTATNITAVTLTMTGSGLSSDISSVKLYRDAATSKNCIYNAGTDVQVGTAQILSGTPPQVSFNITAGDVQTSSAATIACIHVLAPTTSSAQNSKTIQFSIANTADVTNSQSYSFSASSGPPVGAGSSTIVGDPVSDWQGDTTDVWATAANWRPGTVPTSGTDCNVGVGVTAARITTTPVVCQNATFQTGGTINFNGANEFSTYGVLTVQSGFNYTNASTATLSMRGSNNQILDMQTIFPGNFTVANTGTNPSNKATVNSSTTIQGNVSVASGILSIANGITLTVNGNVTVLSGATLEILPGGTLALGNGSVLTVNSGGILVAVGTNSLNSTITSNGSSAAYTILVNGEIRAQYYAFDHLGVNGLSVESGATINATYHFQNGSFSYPVNNNSTFLFLKKQVPSNAISNISFNSGGSVATGTKNINTTGAAAGTLSISTYSGNLAGPAFHVNPTYLISWTGATNTIGITQESTSPTNVDAGSTYNMGRFGFTQTQAGGSYSDANITSLSLTLLGTGTSSDIAEVRIYKDTDCDGLAGTLIGTGTMSGSPPTSTFTIGAGTFVVAAHATSPPKNCVYVEYNISNAATNNKTVGVSLATSTDIVNSQAYLPAGSVSFPITMGTASNIIAGVNTTWTGTTNTTWTTSTNWTSGVPDTTKNCTINNVTNNPVIAAAGAACKNVSIGTGLLTFTNGVSAKLDVSGSFTNTGTITQNDGVIRFFDNGTGIQQSISSSTALSAVQIAKTAGGAVNISGTSLTLNSLVYNTGNTSSVYVANGITLILPNGVSIPNGTLEVTSGAALKIGNTKLITLNGGTFKTSGLHDTYPQATASKGKITVNGSGTWGFTSTSGTLSLVGFLIDYIDVNGLTVGGTTQFTNFRGGQFTNLSTSYSTMKVMQINTSTVPASPSDVEWYWGPNNAPPASSATYKLATSTGCGSNTISFNQWWGDFFDPVLLTPDPATKITQTSCNIVIAYANSPVSLLSFESASYDHSVLLEWVTGSETDHYGFNVYRSLNFEGGYVQINSSLVRNNYANLGPQGSYSFEDTTVENGKIYYYMIEDLSSAGVKKRHGSVTALPLAGLGSPHGPSTGTNSGTTESDPDNSNSPSTGVIENPGAIDLGHGVHILSQTRNSLRVEIVPPPYSLAVSGWNPSYEEIHGPGSSKSLVAGAPELVDKVILIEVDGQPTTTTISHANVFEGAVSNPHLIQPAPLWSLDVSNNLVSNFAPDSAAYALNSFAPSAYYDLASDVKNINGKYFIELTVRPIVYNPTSQSLKPLQRAVLDIGLDGAAWNTVTPPAHISAAPSAVSGVIRVQYEKAGLYEVTFDELAALGIDGYYESTPINTLRAYYRGEEIPIEVRSGDAFFNTGDSIRFFGDFIRTSESNLNEVVISKISLGDLLSTPLRIQNISASPVSQPVTTMSGTEAHLDFEQNLVFLNDRPMGDLADHFYWVRLGKWNSSQVSFYPSSHTFSFYLPGLLRTSSSPVRINSYVRGRTQHTQNATHHIAMTVNNDTAVSAEQNFSDYYPTMLSFTFPSHKFISGTNSVTAKVMADSVPVDDWALMDINKFSVVYTTDFIARNNVKDLYKVNFDEAITVFGYSSSSVSIYDVSAKNDVRILTSTGLTTSDGGVTYDLTFAMPASVGPDLGYHLVAVEDSALLKPKAIFLNEGYEKSLKDPSQRADLIVIGEKEYINSASKLIAQRDREGLNVKAVTYSQIYDEFSNGQASSTAIRDFLTFAYKNWAVRHPRYVLILGDATYDVLNHLNKTNSGKLAPVPLLSGDFADYATDSWFVTPEGSNLPNIAIGRIPAANPLELESFVTKILAYEAGDSAPDDFSARQFGFFSDEDTFHEGFSAKSDQLSESIKSENSKTETWNTKLADAANAAAFKTEIINKFATPPLVMSFVGHGSEDRWADSIFINTDAKALTNTRLPMVVGLNCSTGYFYDPDSSIKGFGEALVMNPAGGAIAYWGSTTYTSPETQVKLTQTFYDNISKSVRTNYKVIRIGDLALQSKVALSNQSTAKDTLRSWVLLGDPSMKLPANSFAKSNSSNSGGGCGLVSTDTPPMNTPSGGLYLFILILPLTVLFAVKRRSSLVRARSI